MFSIHRSNRHGCSIRSAVVKPGHAAETKRELSCGLGFRVYGPCGYKESRARSSLARLTGLQEFPKRFLTPTYWFVVGGEGIYYIGFTSGLYSLTPYQEPPSVRVSIIIILDA